METPVLISIITGIFSLTSVWGSVWLKHYFETPRQIPSKSSGAEAPAPASATPPTAQGGLPIAKPLLIAMVGFFLGLISGFTNGKLSPSNHYDQMFLVVLAGAVCLGLAIASRRVPRGLPLYELGVLGLWAAFASGWSITAGRVFSEVITTSVGLWLASALIGALVIKVANRSR